MHIQGYTFDAEANGHSFTVKVPVGGVEEGQRFSVPFPAGANGYSGAAIPRASVPVGHWKVSKCSINCCTWYMIVWSVFMFCRLVSYVFVLSSKVVKRRQGSLLV